MARDLRREAVAKQKAHKRRPKKKRQFVVSLIGGKKKKNKMSVVGIDFGNANNVVALARRKGIDVVLNTESKRETPCMVNFGEKQVRASALLPHLLPLL